MFSFPTIKLKVNPHSTTGGPGAPEPRAEGGPSKDREACHIAAAVVPLPLSLLSQGWHNDQVTEDKSGYDLVNGAEHGTAN